jgi:hypothetical protein
MALALLEQIGKECEVFLNDFQLVINVPIPHFEVKLLF